VFASRSAGLVTVLFAFLLDSDTNSGIIEIMADIKKILKNMRLNPRNIRFNDISKEKRNYPATDSHR